MSAEAELHYMAKPTDVATAPTDVEFRLTREFLADEAACKLFWELVDTQFRTRSKFLAIWPCVSYVAVHRDTDGLLDGFLLVSCPVNWQIDYVTVRPDSRGQGIATKLVQATLREAALQHVPYVMLTSKESLRPLYESCGFQVVGQPVAV
jgi:GNAT superfamily N-acetyltransferase